MLTGYFTSLQERGELTNTDCHYTISAEHSSSISGIHHVYFIQTLNSLPILGTESSVHFKSDTLLSDHLRFVQNISARSSGKSKPGISAEEAVKNVATSLGFDLSSRLKLEAVDAAGTNYTFRSDLLEQPREASLCYELLPSGEIVLVWKTAIASNKGGEYWHSTVNSLTAEILTQQDLTMYCHVDKKESDHKNKSLSNNISKAKSTPLILNAPAGCTECYEAFVWPVENPYYGDREIAVDPAHPVASPYGWHKVDALPGSTYQITKGNNIDLQTMYQGYAPNGGSTLDFTGFPLDINYTHENPSTDAAGTNAFFVLNKLHDLLYIYGFDEAAGNFQHNNFDRGGIAGDEMLVLMHNEGRCGSSYRPHVDGNNGTVFLGVCNNRDAAIDSDVLIHEYTHGLQSRLIGGPGTNLCFRNRENLLEGISDWYAKIINIKPGDQGTDPKGYGNYLVNEGPEGIGTNRYYYSTNMAINPSTYLDIQDNPGSKHAVGAVWGNILWELSWALIDIHGFDPNITNFTGTASDAGNIRAMAIITEAHKLMPCDPGFVDGRDAILQANFNIYGGESDCYLWDAFAKRGLGIYAAQGDSTIIGDEVEDFTENPREAIFQFEEDVCRDIGLVWFKGEGKPIGGVYSGVGIIDSGNGSSFFVDTNQLTAGRHEIIYSIEETPDCYIASQDVGYVNIFEDVEPPVVTCPQLLLTHYYDEGEALTLRDFTGYIAAYDDCANDLTVEQSPPTDSPTTTGFNTIEISVSDLAGNTSNCKLLVDIRIRNQLGFDIGMYPNPNDGRLFIENGFLQKIESIYIYDLVGRLVKSYDLSKTQYRTELNIESLVQGVYFVDFKFANENRIKRLIRE